MSKDCLGKITKGRVAKRIMPCMKKLLEKGVPDIRAMSEKKRNLGQRVPDHAEQLTAEKSRKNG